MLRRSALPGRLVSTPCLELATSYSQQLCVEQDYLIGRLKSVDTGYHQALRCMEGTRQFLLDEIMDWSTRKLGQDDESNTYWIYGLPGIGKTSLAHSICASLHDRQRLAGAFFCQRDDPNLSEARNILPTLIYKLAIIFPPFRSIVADRFRNDPNLAPESMTYYLFLEFIRKLPRHPQHTFVFVIDALDECGDYRTRPGVLKALTDAAAQAPWLKVIITSRPEADIQSFFTAPTQSAHARYDLATDKGASNDMRTFARNEFDLVASRWHLSTPWPENSLFDKIISQANGLFIFIKTVVLSLEHCKDPIEALEAVLQDSAGTSLNSLYGLYSRILEARVAPGDADFQRVVGVLLTTAPNHSLRDETIAELVGIRPYRVRKWVDDLGSLLYRDDGANGGIRVRHLSISDFFVSDRCDYQVNVQDAQVQTGIASLKTMVQQLRFNICGLEDSRLANKDITNLSSRINENISGALQYSSLYWSDHLCFTPDNGNPVVRGIMEEFFRGLYPLFWIEVLSIMGRVPIGVPSLRRVISWAKVSGAPVCCQLAFWGGSDLL
jgi:hypothetical protein